MIANHMYSAEGDAMLSEQQIDFFNANGFVIAENAVSPAQLQLLRDDFAGWGDLNFGLHNITRLGGHCAICRPSKSTVTGITNAAI